MAINPRYLLALGVVVLGVGTVVALRIRNAPPAPAPAPAATQTATTAAPPAAPPAAPAATKPVLADCLYPGPAPVPPDGSTATEADMKLGHDAIQNYVLELEAYQACRNSQADNSPASVTDQQKQTWLAEGNAAVDQATALASAFSVQLKTYKARNPKS